MEGRSGASTTVTEKWSRIRNIFVLVSSTVYTAISVYTILVEYYLKHQSLSVPDKMLPTDQVMSHFSRGMHTKDGPKRVDRSNIPNRNPPQ